LISPIMKYFIIMVVIMVIVILPLSCLVILRLWIKTLTIPKKVPCVLVARCQYYLGPCAFCMWVTSSIPIHPFLIW